MVSHTKVGDIFADLHHTGYSFMSELAAHRNLMPGIRTVRKHSDICTANAGIQVLHQHIVIADLRQRQLPQFDRFLSSINSCFHCFS